ncbi:MAG: hypothetical protein WCQ60_01695 [bacterium]
MLTQIFFLHEVELDLNVSLAVVEQHLQILIRNYSVVELDHVAESRNILLRWLAEICVFVEHAFPSYPSDVALDLENTSIVMQGLNLHREDRCLKDFVLVSAVAVMVIGGRVSQFLLHVYVRFFCLRTFVEI